MTKNRAIHITALILLAALAVPIQLAAENRQYHHHKPHHYQLVGLSSTFGGPQSYLNPGSGFIANGFTSVLNHGGTVAGFADTSVSDPFPNLCFWDCDVVHAFRASKSGDLTDLGALPGGGSSVPLWITANGLIAGLSENGETDPLYAGLPQLRAVLWQQGEIIDLGTLPEGGYQSAANAVNSAGQVVGAALNTVPDTNSMQAGTFWLFGGDGGITPPYQYQTRAFLWDKQKGMQDLGTLPGGTDAEAILINERGQVLGYSYAASSQNSGCFALVTSSFIWEKDKGMVDLGGFGGTCTLAQDLNNQGEVSGLYNTADGLERAFLWEHGSIHDLGGSIGGKQAGAFAMNEHGQAVGFATLPGEVLFHAALWKQVGKITDLGVVGNDQCSYAAAINADSQVVGSSIPVCNGDSSTFRAILWENGSIFDLNTLIPSSSTLYLQVTETINDRGEIAGTGMDASGNQHAFLLLPCDEDHPNVEGCDYSLVDAVEATRVGPGPAVQRPKTRNESNPQRPVLRQRWLPGQFRSTQQAALSYKAAISGPDATLSPTSLTFSAQRLEVTSPAQTVTLKNTGNARLTITAIAISGTNAADFAQTHTCGNTLVAGASCTMSVTFKPTQIGKRTAALSVRDNAPGSSQTVSLSGTGTEVELAPTYLNFGCVLIFPDHCVCSPPRTTTLTNVGRSALDLTQITSLGPFSQTNTCGASVPAGGSCSITVRWSRSKGEGAVSISDNGGASPQRVSLNGERACNP